MNNSRDAKDAHHAASVHDEIVECRWLIRWLEQRIIDLCACITALRTRITELEAKKRDT